MAINWFEGGRRINGLVMVLVALGGAGYLFFGGSSKVYLFSRAPDDPWHFEPSDCQYPDVEETLWDSELPKFNGHSIALCFKATKSGVPYAEAPPPERVDTTSGKIEDGAAPSGSSENWYWTDTRYSGPVSEYIEKRTGEFVLSPVLSRQIGDGMWKLRWNRLVARFEEAAPVVFGLLLFFWLFSAVIGWIIRGFAGIPSGQDFRPGKGTGKPS